MREQLECVELCFGKVMLEAIPGLEGRGAQARKGQATKCLFHISLHQQGCPLGIPGPRGQAKRLQQGRCTFGGNESGQGILEPDGHP